MPQEHPFGRHGLLRRTWPFGLALLVAFAVVPFEEINRPRAVWLAAGLTVVLVATIALLPWERLPRRAAAIPPLLVVPVAFLLRHGTGGLADPVDFEALLILPVFWFALYGSRREMAATIVAGAATFILSLALATNDHSWAKAVIWPTIAALVGFRAQDLVRQCAYLSRTDVLTDLANRGRFEEELDRQAARARRSEEPLAVALLDLDHFKAVNDREGHRAGDDLLRACAAAWQLELRRGDLLARYGGEEFAVMLPGSDLQQAVDVAERMRRAVPGDATVSIGVALVGDEDEPCVALDRADDALYRAKGAGRDRVEVAT